MKTIFQALDVGFMGIRAHFTMVPGVSKTIATVMNQRFHFMRILSAFFQILFVFFRIPVPILRFDPVSAFFAQAYHKI